MKRYRETSAWSNGVVEWWKGRVANEPDQHSVNGTSRRLARNQRPPGGGGHEKPDAKAEEK